MNDGKREVAIVGFTGTRNEVPTTQSGLEIWGCNNLHAFMERPWTRWFDLHDVDEIRKDTQHVAWLRNATIPTYMWEAQDDFPTSRAYPKREITKTFGKYFTNSISWMIALAIAENFEKISVYGVDMAQACLGPETRVLTADLRWVAHEDVEVGDELLAFDEEPVDGQRLRHFRTTRVDAVRRHLQPCYRILFADGTKVIASTEHPWLAEGWNPRKPRQWSETQNLRAATETEPPSRVVKVCDPWEEDRSRGAGFLAGAVDGEGHLSAACPPQLGFSQRANSFRDAVMDEADKRAFRFSGRPDASGFTRYLLTGGRMEVMRFLGSVRPPRLLNKFTVESLGFMQSLATVPVAEMEYIGLHETVGLEVDAHTYIAEGFATHNTEYASQRPSCEFFLGLAVGRGIEVYIPRASDLLKSAALYGAESDSALRAKLDAHEANLTENLTQATAQRDAANQAILQIQGALETTKYFKSVWTMPEGSRDGQDPLQEPAVVVGDEKVMVDVEP